MKIVMYHYVRRPDASLPFFKFLHADDFARQLDFFQSTSTILSPTDIFNALKGASVPEGFVLTFDDGLKDHFEYVLPELQSRGLQAFFFVSTGWYKHRRMLNVHRIHLLLGKLGGSKMLDLLKEAVRPEMISKERKESYSGLLYPNQQNDEATLAVKQLLNFYIKDENQSSVLDELMKASAIDEQEAGENFYLGKQDIITMQQAGMCIGSHTENHSVLSKLSYAEQENEIELAADFLEHELTMARPTTFCYPYGYAGTFNESSENILLQKNYDCAFMVDARDAVPADFNGKRFALPRYDCNMFPHGQIWKP
jgi:peptidoglycan/xylan/chitin deacetylase (PgdA/CDA1 family)